MVDVVAAADDALSVPQYKVRVALGTYKQQRTLEGITF